MDELNDLSTAVQARDAFFFRQPLFVVYEVIVVNVGLDAMGVVSKQSAASIIFLVKACAMSNP